MASVTDPFPHPVQAFPSPVSQREKPAGDTTTLPPLEAGDHLDQKTFHARYEAMPENTRAELIGGVVYMPSPLKWPHASNHINLSGWIFLYQAATPGVAAGDNATFILGSDDEVQPDNTLILLPELGGQSREDKDGYMNGPPDWIGEIAASSEAYDLHSKKDLYEKAGVKEYVVVALRQSQVFWFVLRSGKYEPLPPGPDGILRSEAFPGLWLDPDALLRQDSKRLLEVLQQGLATPEHAAWVARLTASHVSE